MRKTETGRLLPPRSGESGEDIPSGIDRRIAHRVQVFRHHAANLKLDCVAGVAILPDFKSARLRILGNTNDHPAGTAQQYGDRDPVHHGDRQARRRSAQL